MTILLDDILTPERGRFELTINRTIHIQISAEEARRQVNQWLLDEVSYMIGAEEPMLVLLKEQTLWRVPAMLTAPHVGQVGEVGAIHVDVESGEMDNTPERITELQQTAEVLGKTLPLYRPRANVPDEYLAIDLQPTHSLPCADTQDASASPKFAV